MFTIRAVNIELILYAIVQAGVGRTELADGINPWVTHGENCV